MTYSGLITFIVQHPAEITTFLVAFFLAAFFFVAFFLATFFFAAFFLTVMRFAMVAPSSLLVKQDRLSHAQTGLIQVNGVKRIFNRLLKSAPHAAFKPLLWILI